MPVGLGILLNKEAIIYWKVIPEVPDLKGQGQGLNVNEFNNLIFGGQSTHVQQKKRGAIYYHFIYNNNKSTYTYIINAFIDSLTEMRNRLKQIAGAVL